MRDANSILKDIAAGDVIPNIGQISAADMKYLDRLARHGQIAKWRGKWFPIAGARSGLGPDKNCYGLAETRDAIISMGG